MLVHCDMRCCDGQLQMKRKPPSMTSWCEPRRPGISQMLHQVAPCTCAAALQCRMTQLSWCAGLQLLIFEPMCGNQGAADLVCLPV